VGAVRALLLIRLKDPGEIVMTLPALEVARRALPEARIAMLVEPPNQELLAADPRLTEVILFDKTALRTGPAAARVQAALGFLRRLRHPGFDLVVDLHGNARSALLLRLSGARERVGPHADELEERTFMARWYTRRAPAHAERHRAERRARIVEDALGLPRGEVPEARLLVPPEAREAAMARTRELGIKADDLIIGVHPGAAKDWKCWPKERFVRLMDLLHDELAPRFIVTFGPRERALAEAVASGSRASAVCFGGTLGELVAMAACCSAFVTNDTAPMHIAAAVGTPTLGIFGPTNPAKTRAYSSWAVALRGEGGAWPSVEEAARAALELVRRRSE
jgi:heptosyltransferase-3